MSDIYDLYDFDDRIEDAIKAVLVAELTAATITCEVWTSREGGKKGTPRLEVSFSLHSAMAQRTAAGQATPKQVPNSFEGSVAITLSTTRPSVAGNADQHGRIRGLARYVMTAGAKKFNGTNLPGIQILEMLPEEQTPRVYDGKSQDLSILGYRIWFAIPNNAWPSTA
jgi:hypothetical protein